VEDVTELVRLKVADSEKSREVILRAREVQDQSRQLRAANERLAELDRAKTTFFSNVSHEFRTPLTLLLGPVEDALASGRALAGEELAEMGRGALPRLRLVNGLPDFARIEARRFSLAFEPTNLAELTADLASSFRTTIERAGLSLVVDCPPLDEAIHVDRLQWEKIVLNLVSNPFRFTFAP